MAAPAAGGATGRKPMDACFFFYALDFIFANGAAIACLPLQPGDEFQQHINIGAMLVISQRSWQSSSQKASAFKF
jgi:hypothetical protein